jgi:hypothetical protein
MRHRDAVAKKKARLATLFMAAGDTGLTRINDSEEYIMAGSRRNKRCKIR